MHGFLPDLLCLVHQNARKVLGSTTPGCYFPHPVNASCHDITEAKSLPYSAKKVLGLGGKFIKFGGRDTGVDSLDYILEDDGFVVKH